MRPRLWVIALRTGFSLVPNGWWHRPPFLPLPDRGWLAFRIETAYGDAGAPLDEADVVDFLEWCRSERRSLSEGRTGHTAALRQRRSLSPGSASEPR